MNIAIKLFVSIPWRLVSASCRGARQACDAAYSKKSRNWKEAIWNDAVAYFAPLTGACSGFSKELKKYLQ